MKMEASAFGTKGNRESGRIAGLYLTPSSQVMSDESRWILVDRFRACLPLWFDMEIKKMGFSLTGQE